MMGQVSHHGNQIRGSEENGVRAVSPQVSQGPVGLGGSWAAVGAEVFPLELPCAFAAAQPGPALGGGVGSELSSTGKRNLDTARLAIGASGDVLSTV
jgi:hypothetical protein